MLKLCLLILVSTVAYVYSAVAIYPYKPKPAEYADVKGCWNVDLELVLPYNVPYYPPDKKSCMQYICGTNNETQLFSCGSIGFSEQNSENCRLVRDLTLNYPKCCGTVVCDPTTTTQEPTTEPITEEPTTETCVTVTEDPCEGATPPRKPKLPKNTKVPPKAPECPKTP